MFIVLGEILFDIFPDYRRMGGAPFNFAYHITQMGFPVHLSTRVGDDEDGRRIIAKLNTCGFFSLDVQVDTQHPTGRVDISLDAARQPTFNIVPDVAYDYLILDRSRLPLNSNPVLVYYGTLVQRTRRGFNAVQDFLKIFGSRTRLFCDINLRPACYTMEVIHESLKSADILKLNDVELSVIGKELYFINEEDRTVERLMQDFGIEMVALTKGANGSTIYTRSGRYEKPSPEVSDIADTVGAGDAYAAVLACGLSNGWTHEKILDKATQFASDICSIEGAIPAGEALYNDIRR